MSVQDDKAEEVAVQDSDQQETNKGQATEKPEPDEDAKRKAAEMMTAYTDRPTLVLPGTDGMVSGTAVNDWLDADGNPKIEGDEGSEASDDAESGDMKEQIEKDKALNEELRRAAAEENKGEKD